MPFVRLRPFRLLLFAVVLVPLLFHVVDGEAQGEGAIRWEPCGGDWECGLLDAPLDYDQPDGETIELALIRLPASNPDERIGVLLANPGGPGGEALEFTRLWSNLLDRSITDRFDIVAFDPRGVGRSTPLVCHETLLEFTGIDPAPQSVSAFNRLKAAAERFAADCVEQNEPLILEMGTVNVAHDMDRIRQALGEEQLNYIGYSYGTRLGSVYTDHYPERVRAFVLDGAVDNSLSETEAALQQVAGFERALQNFIDDCEQRACALANDDDIYAKFQQVLERSRSNPIPAPGANRDAGPGEVVLGIIAPLYNRLTWPMLENAVATALDGDGLMLVRLADTYLGRQDNGEYSNIREANFAINCADAEPGELIDTYEDYLDALPEFEQASPLLGATSVISGCIGWPVGSDPVGVPDAEGAPPILVVGTTGDPATPYEWAEAMASQIGSAVLLTHEGEGHTAYSTGMSSCINGVVNAYLVELVVPEHGTSCTGNAAPERPGQVQPHPGPTQGETADRDGDGDGGLARVAIVAVVVVAALILVVGAGVALIVFRRNH